MRTADLQIELDRLIGLTCWATTGGVGSIVTADMGKKILRDKPGTNQHLDEELRRYRGEFGLMIYCAWRLQSDTAILAISGEPAEVVAFPQLIGSKVKVAKVHDVGLDVDLIFESGHQLKIFCDQPADNDATGDYVIFSPGYSVGVHRGKAVKKAREV